MIPVTGRTALAVGVVLVAGIAVGAGLWLAGSPADARLQRLDLQRVADLQQASRAIDAFWTETGRLPARLEDLPGAAEVLRAAESRGGYTYRVLDAGRYELCATFDRPGTGTAGRPTPEFWAHEAGRRCYLLEPRKVER
jgi:hypothetical protein